jgi:hypothetical protein
MELFALWADFVTQISRCGVAPKITAFWQNFLATLYPGRPAALICTHTVGFMLLDIRWLQYLLKRTAR